jgi:hypothetical protein
MTTKDDGIQRSFETGATRDTGEGKLDFEGFLSPFVLRQYAKYMNMNRLQSDGNLRDSDNWQKGIPMEVYMKSLYRHFFETWYTYRMDRALRDDRLHMPREQQVEYIGALCGMMFNAMGYLHEWLKLNPEVSTRLNVRLSSKRQKKNTPKLLRSIAITGETGWRL